MVCAMRSGFRCFKRIAAIPLTFLILALWTLPAAAERQAWDQATVTKLAAELADATRALKNTLRREPHIADATKRLDRNASRLQEAVNALDKSSQQLKARTASGKGYEDTLATATKIQTQVRDAQQYGASVMTTAFMEEKIQPVRELLKRLSVYYF